jgi:YebC/PmpR family DNA-binding regulatory protein
MSGHSKWANIKHKKAAKDSKRGKVFTRIGKEMTIAAREGGGDPDMNPRLRLAIQNAKAENIPAENIKRAIQKGTGEIEGVNYEEITYEGFAPLGVSIMLETITDNRNRTVSEVRSQFGKLGGNLAEPGSVGWNFERKGVITIKTDNKSEDELLEHVLESGAEDMEFDEEETRIICSYDALSSCSKYFNEKKFELIESKFEYIPKTTVKLDNLNDAKRVLKFIDSIEDMDDVQNIYGNYEINDELLEQLDNE